MQNLLRKPQIYTFTNIAHKSWMGLVNIPIIKLATIMILKSGMKWSKPESLTKIEADTGTDYALTMKRIDTLRS